MRLTQVKHNLAFVQSAQIAKRSKRNGVVAAESAVVLGVMLIFCIAVLDLGMNVARSNSLSDCARHAARYAILHGSRSPTSLGPQHWSGTLDENHPVTNVIRNRLLGMAPSSVNLTLTWPDGGNEASARVSVELSYQPPRLSMLSEEISPLRAKSIMRILR